VFNLFAIQTGRGHQTRSDSRTFEAVAEGTNPTRQSAKSLRRNVLEFSTALRSFMNQATAPLVLCFCQEFCGRRQLRTEVGPDDAEQRLLLEAAKFQHSHHKFVVAVASLSGQRLLRSAQSSRRPYSYTEECYAAIGSMLIRTIFNLRGNPSK